MAPSSSAWADDPLIMRDVGIDANTAGQELSLAKENDQTSASTCPAQNAKLLSPREALEVGLVNEVVPKAQLENTATAVMQSMLKFPDSGRAVCGQTEEGWGRWGRGDHSDACRH